MKSVIYLILIFICLTSFSQEGVLDSYVKTGIENNLAIQQKQASYEKSIAILKEAKGLFFPNISINARYSVASGGRTIDIPVDEMLNPVYQNLNAINQQLFAALPPEMQPEEFPMLETQSINFMRPTEHETKVRVVQPIFNSQIYYNSKIKKELTNVEKADLATYKRQLIAEIKTAYYLHLQSLEYEKLLNKTELLVKENIRVNKKLFENDKITIDNVYRAETELHRINKLQADAEKGKKTSQSYFNFLINRPLNTEIEIDSLNDTKLITYDLEQAKSSAVTNREEIQMVSYYNNVSGNNIKLNQFNALPTISGVFDYGFQGEEYNFSNEYDYFMASIVMQWDLFKGLQNKHKIQQAKIDKHIIETKKNELENQVNLQVINSFYELEAAYKAVILAESEVKSSNKAFNILNKKFNQGQSPLIEYIDARTSLTNAQHNLIINKYDFLIKNAEFERVACLYNINSIEN
ncbi:TolC family protein [Bacteroidota bacterium]